MCFFSTLSLLSSKFSLKILKDMISLSVFAIVNSGTSLFLLNPRLFAEQTKIRTIRNKNAKFELLLIIT